MSPVANRLRAYLPPQAVQPSGSIAIFSYVSITMKFCVKCHKVLWKFRFFIDTDENGKVELNVPESCPK